MSKRRRVAAAAALAAVPWLCLFELANGVVKVALMVVGVVMALLAAAFAAFQSAKGVTERRVSSSGHVASSNIALLRSVSTRGLWLIQFGAFAVGVVVAVVAGAVGGAGPGFIVPWALAVSAVITPVVVELGSRGARR